MPKFYSDLSCDQKWDDTKRQRTRQRSFKRNRPRLKAWPETQNVLQTCPRAVYKYYLSQLKVASEQTRIKRSRTDKRQNKQQTRNLHLIHIRTDSGKTRIEKQNKKRRIPPQTCQFINTIHNHFSLFQDERKAWWEWCSISSYTWCSRCGASLPSSSSSPYMTKNHLRTPTTCTCGPTHSWIMEETELRTRLSHSTSNEYKGTRCL